ncbi:MAG TPA: TonB-dependent receptor [Sphingomicrobium sp.]|nr:TonB-dependent receptor [Sphingomicrobium sp.]
MFDVAPGRLGNVLIQFGDQAGLNVGLNDPALVGKISKGAKGRLTNQEALRQILLGTGATVVWLDYQSVRVVRAQPSPPRTRQSKAAKSPRPIDQVIAPSEIVVTASKRQTPLRDYPGSVSIVDLRKGNFPTRTDQGTGEIVARLPILASTHLGPGRNKLFIRGVADSSFSGFSQTTVGEYLGDVRLTYYAPDPNLNLYDMDRVEVLEGPQGTLYGTGGLGGVIRLVPNAPDFKRNSLSMSAAMVSVAHGSSGYDAAGMANVVLEEGRAAIRAVVYRSSDPGYINDPSRELVDVNRTSSHGGRVALAVNPIDDWTVTVGAVVQDISTRDAQYVLRGSPRLERSTVIAQPFDNDYALAYVTLDKGVAEARLTSTTSLVRHDVDEVADATVTTSPRKFEQETAISLLSHESRLSRRNGDHSWVVGFSGLLARARTSRRLGDIAAPELIAEVRNLNLEGAIFGQYSRELGHGFALTGGARLSYAKSNGEVADDGPDESSEPTRTQIRLSPMTAVSWQIDSKLLAFVHYQSAFRPGLLEVAPDGQENGAHRIDADTISMIEAGARYGEPGRDPLSFSAGISYARWTDIQADQIDEAGLPFTENIGDGRIKTFEAQATWHAFPGFNFETSVFVGASRLAKPMPKFADANERELPNIPHVGARVAANYERSLNRSMSLSLNGSARYVGSSDLGIGFPLDVSQGNYLDVSVGARIEGGPVGLSIDVDNLFDTRGNRFAFGNPFTIDQQDQLTPLVPRRIRVGMDARF